ncbi:MAG: hypothetical protein M1470_02710 [Bacteroidetes bacterium]|nr:hypothetical protein [Bacteroidota bacterium]MCL5737542.1 hypothetical protein [Bacteroidota bacterium]
MMEDRSNSLGIFHRAFPVQLPEEPIRFMTAQVKNVANIDNLKYQKWLSKSESSVFTLGEQAFGYGTGMEKFADDGFSETQLILKDSPQLAEGLIIEGLVDDARTRGRHYFGIYRNSCKMIPDDDCIVRGDFMIRIGYDVSAIHWNYEESTMFGLIIEPAWIIQRGKENGQSMSGYLGNAERELMKIHGVEPAEDYIMSFVDSHREFLLPCGGKAKLGSEAVTIFTEMAE